MSPEKILVVDDDTNILEVIKMRLEVAGYKVTTATSGEQALVEAQNDLFNLVVTDLKMSPKNGIKLMEELLLINPEMPIIILTAHGTIENAVEAIKKGAYSYLTKPFDHKELILHIKNALEKQQLTYKIKTLQTIIQEKYSFDNIVGKSGKMRKVFEQITLIAKTDSTVYIYGETGTGKELVAKAIHCSSHRADGPFIAVSCGAIPETLLENELFGHVKGAYTDAHETKKGLFAQADKGTIFLDEIGETPHSLQVKLLRALQEQEVKPIGSNCSVRVDIRVIVATNKNLQKAVEEGKFREDLFYRIHVIPIHLPPLRERKEDIPLLANYLLEKYCRKLDKKIDGITPSAIRKMMLYNWPGNVRELENKIEYAVAMCTKTQISSEDIFLTLGRKIKEIKSFKEAKKDFEKEYLIYLLKINKGHITNTAKMAKKHRSDLYNLIKKYKINPKDYR
ncbi:MAG: sigma-54-dependent Fis family transcriptional regulator [Candidatus Aminicenantes bacterium]|nr:sigma-54-dependent Fis family transcriptional regulator [Candidatus Aminicenantes bacterium]